MVILMPMVMMFENCDDDKTIATVTVEGLSTVVVLMVISLLMVLITMFDNCDDDDGCCEFC